MYTVHTGNKYGTRYGVQGATEPVNCCLSHRQPVCVFGLLIAATPIRLSSICPVATPTSNSTTLLLRTAVTQIRRGCYCEYELHVPVGLV